MLIEDEAEEQGDASVSSERDEDGESTEGDLFDPSRCRPAAYVHPARASPLLVEAVLQHLPLAHVLETGRRRALAERRAPHLFDRSSGAAEPDLVQAVLIRPGRHGPEAVVLL